MSRVPVPSFAPGSRIRRSDLAKLAGAVPQIRGDGRALVSRSGSQVMVHTPQQPYPTFPVFFGRVVSSSQVAPNQWTYQVEQITKGDAGYAATEPYPGGGYTGTAYNMLELGNTASGLQGNGVNTEDLPEGFSLGPIPSGQWPHPVFLWAIAVAGGRTLEMWFSYSNPIVGECPP